MKIYTKLSILFGFLAMMLFSTNAEAKSERIEPETLEAYAKEIGEMYNINPYILYAMCETESSRVIHAENGSCKGLMQVSEKWHSGRMEKLGVEDIFDPYGNILVAADFLAELYEINSDTYYVLMRYNMTIKSANKLYEEGKISYYARSIVERAEELEAEAIEKEKKSLAKNEAYERHVLETNVATFVSNFLDICLS